MSFFDNHLTCPLESCSSSRFPEAFATPSEGSESLTRSDPPFDGSVVLLHNIIQVAYGPASAAPAEFAGLLEFGYDFGIRGVSIHVNDSRPGMAWRTQCLLQKAFGRSRVTLGTQEKVDRGAG
jgi:hypothetical protein